jgi:hypothetical protein
MKNRLPDPSEICALEFKGKFRGFRICSVSATIDNDWSILDVHSLHLRDPPRREKTVTDSKKLAVCKRHVKASPDSAGLHPKWTKLRSEARRKR